MPPGLREPDEATLSALRDGATELEQAACVLTACGVDPATTTLADGDRLLLAVCAALGGPDLELALQCPLCCDVSAVRLTPDTVPPALARSAVLGTGGGLRQPTYRDLMDLPPDETATVALLERCRVGDPARPATAEDLAAVDDSLAGPMVFACAGCGADVEHPVDVQTVALRELLRVLDRYDVDVHLLASAYHWSAADIDALPRERRRRLAALVADRPGLQR